MLKRKGHNNCGECNEELDEVTATITPYCKIYEINFYGDVNYKNMSALSDILREVEANDQVILNINSSGGNLLLLEGVSVLLKNVSCLTTIIEGQAASAAALMFMLGEHRKATKFSSMLIHTASMELGSDTLPNHNNLVAHVHKQINIQLEEVFREYLSKEEMASIQDGRDLWLTAQECLDRKIIQEII